MTQFQKTYSIKASDVDKKWYIIDADGKVLGRLATQIALILRGKNNPQFTPSMDMGDYVIIINAEKVVLTGSKAEDKEYFHHTLHPGGKKLINIKKLWKSNPQFIIEHAVKGMLPKNKLGKQVLKNLKVYPGSEHPHNAQKPEVLNI